MEDEKKKCEGCHKFYEGQGNAVMIPHPTNTPDTLFRLVCDDCKLKLVKAWNGLANGKHYTT